MTRFMKNGYYEWKKLVAFKFHEIATGKTQCVLHVQNNILKKVENTFSYR